MQQATGTVPADNEGNWHKSGRNYILAWIDVDLERKTISLTPEKGSNPRVLRISGRLLNMLQETQIAKVSRLIPK